MEICFVCNTKIGIGTININMKNIQNYLRENKTRRIWF